MPLVCRWQRDRLCVAIEMFRSPIDAGTTYLPYVAVVSIAAVALTFLVTRRDATVPGSEVERL